MRWFEHRTDAANNKKIRKIEIFYKERGGQAVMAATGRFWRMMEIIGQQGQSEDGLDSFSLPDDYGLEILADDLYCTIEELREFLDLLAEVNSIDGEAWRNENRIYSPKLGERADTYTKNLKRIRSKSGESSKTLRTVFEDSSKKVLESSRMFAPQAQAQAQETPPPTPPKTGGNGVGDFSEWFEAYPIKRRKDRMKAEQEWQRLRKKGRLPPTKKMLRVLALQARSEEWAKEEGRFIPLPHKYLMLGRFEDASVSPAREPPAQCSKCSGSGFRKAGPEEDGAIGGRKVCECKSDQEARGP